MTGSQLEHLSVDLTREVDSGAADDCLQQLYQQCDKLESLHIT